MTTVLIDILVLMILGFSVWQGYRKGFILSVSSIVILLLGIIVGGRVADVFTEQVAENIEPMLGWVVEDAVDEASKQFGRINELTNTATLQSIGQKAFETLGISGSAAKKMTGDALDWADKQSLTIREGIAHVFVTKMTWLILFIIGFSVFSLMMTLVAHFISTVFQLPVLRQLDMFGGIACGFVTGLVIMFAIGWTLRYVGVLLPAGLLDDTLLLRFFMNTNPISAIFG